MYCAYAEKQKNSFLRTWRMREVVFDVTGRYLYYSDEGITQNPAVPPSIFQEMENGASHRLQRDGSPEVPHELSQGRWRNTLKVDFMIPVA